MTEPVAPSTATLPPASAGGATPPGRRKMNSRISGLRVALIAELRQVIRRDRHKSDAR